MMCPRCRHENEAGAKFCEECAAPLARACAKCGRPLSPIAKFCPECAHPTGSSAAPAPAQRFDSPESHIPRHLAEKILTSKSALEGERKQVTVLFADLKGSMELLADRDPEEARKILDPVLERMMEGVHRYEGTVNQVMGDGIMALFGAPLAHEDHAVRACYAALRMQESVKRYAEGVRREHGITVRIRVGLNSGEVVVRAIGSDLHMDYTAVGQTTHLAARMEQLADPGAILLTPETLAAAEGFVRVNALGPMALKGVSVPVEVYELVGVSAVRSRLQAAATRGLSRFVGRDAEIEQLRRALEHARQGRGQVAAIVGEPGVGKSRLVFELTHSHRVEGWLVLESGSVSYGKATSYLPVIDLLKAYFRIGDRDTYRDIRERVTGKILTLDRALEPALPALLSLLDVPVEDPQWAALDPPQRRQRTLESVKRLLLRETQAQPVLLVFEDLHWIDSETQALLDSLIESLPTARMLLLVNYRPEYRHGWGQKTYYGQLRLDPLPPASSGELLDGLIGGNPSLLPLKALLARSTGGNPLFLEESVRTLVEENALVGERGAYRLAQAVETVRVPATAQAILAARIDRLPPEDKRLLQAASVVGKDVPFVLLQAIADMPEGHLRQGLAHLQSAEFLYETSLFPDLEYTFKHALTHEVAYGSLVQDRRRALHGRIAATIERLYPDRLAEHVEPLAHHAFRGDRWEKAVTYLRQAGTKAAMRSAYREAVACFEQALVALKHLPENREVLEQAVDLRLDLRNALYPLGEFERVLDYLREADTLATALNDRHRRAWVATYTGTQVWHLGDRERAVEFGQRGLDLAQGLEDVALSVQASSRLGWIYYPLGAYERAIDLLTQSLAPLRGALSGQRLGMPGLPSVISRMYLTWALAELGKFVDAAAEAEEGLRIAEHVGEPVGRVAAYIALGSLRRGKGDLGEAIPVLERAHALCQEANQPTWLPITAAELGYAYALSGRLGEALPLLEWSTERIDVGGVGVVSAGWLSEGYLLAERIDDAIRGARRAFELAHTREERGYEAWALRLLGEIASHRNHPDVEAAEAHHRAAITLALELGMRPLVAHCHLGLGKLYRSADKRQEAQKHLKTAATMYREMGMTFWLEKAEAELGGVER
jgi:class 3 adenylate cyclase/tetratricopeptide (TPR) repeat protein